MLAAERESRFVYDKWPTVHLLIPAVFGESFLEPPVVKIKQALAVIFKFL